MDTMTMARARVDQMTDAPMVDVVVPVYNEEAALAASVERLHTYLSTQFPFTWRVTIADNASTDATAAIGAELAARHDGVRFLHLDRKGRGLALRTAWTDNDAAVVAYTDVDLSTGLDALLPLVAPLVSGHSDVAIGSRLAAGANVARGPRREAISRSYNLILRVLFANRFRDAQCGFKAVRSDVARTLRPRHRGRRLVLRHRAAAAGRAQRPAHPRGGRRLDGRPRQPGGRGPHGSRRPARRGPHGVAVRRRSGQARFRPRRPASVRRRRRSPPHHLRRRRAAQHRRVAGAVPVAAPRPGAGGGGGGGPGRHGHRQRVGPPALLVRSPLGRRPPAPSPGRHHRRDAGRDRVCRCWPCSACTWPGAVWPASWPR